MRVRRSANSPGWALVAELSETADLLERVVAQTRLRLAGQTSDGATRIISLHDPDARPIAKGRLGRPVEFGYKAQAADDVDGWNVRQMIGRFRRPGTPLAASSSSP